MGVSVIQEQHDVIVNTIKNITQGDWKVLVVDETSKKIIDNVASEDDILNLNVANIEFIEKRRDMNPGMDAIYFLSPQPHIIDCLMSDFDRRRYRKAFLVWVSILDPKLRHRIYQSPAAQNTIASFDTLAVDFFPRESHLVTFRDPWSFPILYHPGCNDLIRDHMQTLAQRITAVCVTLGEYPKVRYYRPKNPIHEAAVMCSHLARFVQEELDTYAQWNKDFPPQTSRPQGTLVITDRSMDLTAPFVHEFTYQAMAHDLLPIREGEKIMYRTVIDKGGPAEEEVDYELTDKDKVWVENRHRHMKDTIEKLMTDFRKFLEAHPHFVDQQGGQNSVNSLREMMGGLKEFGEMKAAYSLHMSMAQDAMNLFERHKLSDVALAEQSLATGLDEENRRPRNILEEVVKLLDDEAISPGDRLRLIVLYILYRGGVVAEDVKRLLAHAQLPQEDTEVIRSLELLGGRVHHALKEPRQPQPSVFPKNPKPAQVNEEYALSRFEPAVQSLVEDLASGTLDQTTFPYVKPPIDPNEDYQAAQQGSLRAGRPNWAAAGRRPVDTNRQRFVIFMAGGATFGESRACYDVGAARDKDVFLTTSHMVPPPLFVRQLRDLARDPRRLDLPAHRPKPRAPDWVHERPAPPPMAAPSGQRPRIVPGGSSGGGLPPRPVAAPPTGQMGSLSLGDARPPPPPQQQQQPGIVANSGASSQSPAPSPAPGPHKLEKKKRNLFGMKKSKG
ncbi:Sec1 family superfamily protein [Sodiomyces alkalinus F11]|uniref:Sec1 family superfamily protein n=1 Tax=Sodiomyces alkalinus (strain CBS 110278 / VKM F-3762 / F11) TaxID=1314773 RepID=A0A3N2Q5D0_SODAK|nr:Sec1 family superfamily protein [Sodiomyces alkalinus F11]ROT41835.1 Sec1 family superfamily protein [Sodiomyces alkalinus F11]